VFRLQSLQIVVFIPYLHEEQFLFLRVQLRIKGMYNARSGLPMSPIFSATLCLLGVSLISFVHLNMVLGYCSF